MQTVEVTALLDAPRTAVEDALSPRAIVEYEGTYQVQSVEERDDGWIVVADAQEIDAILRFTKRSDGYEYEQIEEGPFEDLRTTVTVSDAAGTDAAGGDRDGDASDSGTVSDGGVVEGTETDESPTRVTLRSEFTFGGLMSPLLDWLAKDSRQNELERVIVQLAEDVGEASSDG